MKHYLLSPEAKTDITNIRQYTTQQWGKTQADNPILGRARDEIKEGYRSFSEGNHVIFYRMAGSAIEVIGIPHQNMDIEQNLSSGNLLLPDIADHEPEDG
ncbi:type II toxin-antitoxin system RelE/ParE family toxin [Nitrosomonas europaea]|uniref:type II toxin-antitoxin system RelE/ParE family toxin n=1 Tax=Nitrosomonas europaea TaxID=915 RepID=UPI000792170B|nr:type II toxin-antitoxin system RelE/ParE family toxin [Nitrosomonas europaea]KXK43525.1 MAG: plasmid stabilization protein ParE [Nitrosomonas europaea]